MEHLNHVVSGAGASYDPTKPQQWVSSQLLLCKKCNNHQTVKIKQLASFLPREEVRAYWGGGGQSQCNKNHQQRLGGGEGDRG